MSTRSITLFVDNEFSNSRPICAMYRHCDGYLSGHGKELKEFLTGFEITNGISSERGKKTANGCGCLAAQVISHFKDGPGGIYLHSVEDRQAYNYTVTTKSGQPIQLTIESYGKQLYDGPLAGFDPDMQESDDDE